jgi:hypothetical protein
MASGTTEQIRSDTEERPALGAKPEPSRPIALFIAIGVLLAAAAGTGGWFLGGSTGEDLDAARAAGTQAGQKQGAATGKQAGYDAGFKEGRAPAYSAAYDKAYRAAYRTAYVDGGQQPPGRDSIQVPSQ